MGTKGGETGAGPFTCQCKLSRRRGIPGQVWGYARSLFQLLNFGAWEELEHRRCV